MACSIAKKKYKIEVSFVDEPASEGVTGSMVYVSTPNHNLLIECGMHQSNNSKKDYEVNSRNYKEFKPKEIDTVFLCHTHGDHTFLLPLLYKRGCVAKTIMPNKSKSILDAMLRDCAFINGRDADSLTRKYKKEYLPLFENEDVDYCMNYVFESEVKEIIKIDDEISYRFIPSGHIPFACQLELYITVNNHTTKILYTSDIGNIELQQPFTEQFESVSKANIIIAENTYAGRTGLQTGKKERQNDLDKIKSIVENQVLERRGRVLIPVFAQTRCQIIAWYLYELFKNREDFDCKVYVDSPLCCKVFELYSQLLEGEEKRKIDELLAWDKLVLVKDAEDSRALVQSKEPCVILSSSGMATAGRSVHHIKSLVSNSNATILFVGYASPYTLAGKLKDHNQKTITIDTKVYPIRCNSYSLKSMSSHINHDSMLQYYSSIRADKIYLHHADMTDKLSFKEELNEVLKERLSSTKVIAVNSSTKISI